MLQKLTLRCVQAMPALNGSAALITEEPEPAADADAQPPQEQQGDSISFANMTRMGFAASGGAFVLVLAPARAAEQRVPPSFCLDCAYQPWLELYLLWQLPPPPHLKIRMLQDQ